MTLQSQTEQAVEPSIGELVKEATTQFSTVLHGEIELAKLELKQSLKFGGIGIGLFIAAAVIIPFALTFGLIAFAEGLITLGIWRWAAYLIVFGSLIGLSVLLGIFGFLKVRKVRAPERTISTSKDTVAVLKTAGQPRT